MLTTQLLLAMGLLLGLTGCSLRYDFTECASNADCAGVEGNGQFYVCDTAKKQCIIEEGVECRADTDCTTGNLTKCTANTCVDPNPKMDMSKDMPDMGDMQTDMNDMSDSCTKNSECIADKGAGFLCGGDGKCFSALSEDCTSLRMPKNGEEDNIVIVASLLPLVEPFGSSIGIPLANAMEFAQDQFNGEGGLPGGRKIAWLSCDTKGNTAVSNRAATHAVNVGAPALVGPLFSENYIAVATDVAKPTGTFIIAPTATSPAITNLHTAEDDLSWRNIPSDLFQGAAFVKRVAQLGVPKVLVLYKDDKYGQDLQAQISPSLINTLMAANVRVAKYDNPITIPDETTRRNKYGMIVQQQLTGFEPQAVLIIGTSEGAEIGGAYLTVANALGQSPGKIIFSHGVVAVMPEFAQNVPKAIIDNNLVEAIAPVIFDPSAQGYKNFALAYNLAFNSTNSSLVATTTFDAAMTIFFSMSTIASDAPITGSAIAKGIPRLIDKDQGVEIEFFVTPSFAGKARQELEAGRNIDMIGVSGQLDYDLTTGDIYNRFFGWEIAEDPVNGFGIVPRRLLTFTAPPATDGEWQNIPSQ